MPALGKGQPGKEVLGVSIKQTSRPALQMCSWLVSSRSDVCLASCSKSVSYSGHTLKFLSGIQVLSRAPWPEARSFPAIPGASRGNPVGQPLSCDSVQEISGGPGQPGPEARLWPQSMPSTWGFLFCVWYQNHSHG